jgi:hypothetical protein
MPNRHRAARHLPPTCTPGAPGCLDRSYVFNVSRRSAIVCNVVPAPPNLQATAPPPPISATHMAMLPPRRALPLCLVLLAAGDDLPDLAA